MASTTVTSLFNSQPHVDSIAEGLIGTEEHESDKFTFMLRHKHFDLSPGEVLFVDKVERGYNVTVRNHDALENCSPCMWLYSSGWQPFGYTRAELGYETAPVLAPGSYNLGVRWLNNGGTESTDEDIRLQWVRPEASDEGTSITTFVNWDESSECESKCVIVKCQRRENSVVHVAPKHHKHHYY